MQTRQHSNRQQSSEVMIKIASYPFPFLHLLIHYKFAFIKRKLCIKVWHLTFATFYLPLANIFPITRRPFWNNLFWNRLFHGFITRTCCSCGTVTFARWSCERVWCVTSWILNMHTHSRDHSPARTSNFEIFDCEYFLL